MIAATVVETKELLQTVAAAFVAGVGVAAVFSIMIFAAARTADLVRSERRVAATATASLMVVAGAGVLASVAFGVIVMTQKS